MIEELVSEALTAVMLQDALPQEIHDHTHYWVISRDDDDLNIKVRSGEDNADFSFTISESRGEMCLRNSHREATLGMGTPTLEIIQYAFQSLADQQERGVSVMFPHFDQKDTIVWMHKNKYTLFGDIFEKTITPDLF